MKLPKIVFSLLAIALAVGAAFASRPSTADMFQGYVQLTNPPRCEKSIQCDNGQDQACLIGSQVVYATANGTQCLTPLTRSDPDGL